MFSTLLVIEKFNNTIEIREDLNLLTVILLISKIKDNANKNYLGEPVYEKINSLSRLAEEYFSIRYICILEKLLENESILNEKYENGIYEDRILVDNESIFSFPYYRKIINNRLKKAFLELKKGCLSQKVKEKNKLCESECFLSRRIREFISIGISHLFKFFKNSIKNKENSCDGEILSINLNNLSERDFLVFVAHVIKSEILKKNKNLDPTLSSSLNILADNAFVDVVFFLKNNIKNLLERASEKWIEDSINENRKIADFLRLYDYLEDRNIKKAITVLLKILGSFGTSHPCYLKHINRAFRILIKVMEETGRSDLKSGYMEDLFHNIMEIFTNNESALTIPVIIEDFSELDNIFLLTHMNPLEISLLDLIIDSNDSDIAIPFVNYLKHSYHNLLHSSMEDKIKFVVGSMRILLYILNRTKNILIFGAIISILLNLKEIGLIEFEINSLTKFIKQKWSYLQIDQEKLVNYLIDEDIEANIKRTMLLIMYLGGDETSLITNLNRMANFLNKDSLSLSELRLSLDIDIIKFLIIKEKLLRLNVPNLIMNIIKRFIFDIIIDFMKIVKTDILNNILLFRLYNELSVKRNTDLEKLSKLLRSFVEIWKRIPSHLSNMRGYHTNIVSRIVLNEVTKNKVTLDEFKEFLCEITNIGKVFPLPSHAVSKMKILGEIC